MKENNLGWHFTRGDKLRDGRPIPPVGEVLVHEGSLELCLRGLHCSVRLIDALMYAPGATLHQVSFGGDVFWGVDKLVSSKRTILRTLPQTETMSVLVKFAQWCAHRAEEATKTSAWAAEEAEEAEEAARAAAEAAAWAERAEERAAEATEATRAAVEAAWAAGVAAEAAAMAAERKAEEEIQNAKLLALVEEAFLDLGGGL